MMWNWFSKLIGKKRQSQRKRVQVDIPFEQHSYRKADFVLQKSEPLSEEDKSTN